MFLDTRPSDPNKAVQMETQHIPAYTATDAKGDTYARVAPLQFPAKADGDAPLIHRITAYNRAALWDGVQAWFDGGKEVSGVVDPGRPPLSTPSNPRAARPGRSTRQTHRERRRCRWPGTPSPTPQLDDTTYGYKWAKEAVTQNGSLTMLPEYYRLEKDKQGKQRWAVVDAKDVPAETGLAKVEFPRRARSGSQTLCDP
ncbi:MAG: hypothetical protein U0792_12210 [Gemmataceae bacterium]